MIPNLFSAARRRGAAAGALVALAALAACSEQNPAGTLGDRQPPSIQLTAGQAPNDSTVSFEADIADNLGIKSARIRITGPIDLQLDTAFSTNQTAMTLPYVLTFPSTLVPGTAITLIATAMDGARNSSAPDTLVLTIGGGEPPSVRLDNPRATDTLVVNQLVPVTITGFTQVKVRSLGVIVAGVVNRRDSVVFNNPLLENRTDDTTFSIPAGSPSGTVTITPFMVDSLGRTLLGTPITIPVLAAPPPNTRPVVNFFLTPRVEVRDTIRIEATDLAGIDQIGYDIRHLDGTLITTVTQAVAPPISPFRDTLRMNLPLDSFPVRVLVRAFARNTAGRADTARLSSGVVRVDTVLVVAGTTQPLPAGGLIADALYHGPSDKLYLSNIDRNRLEVFYLADSSFKDPVLVGSRPWGLAGWPRDRNGLMGDTVVVANSGGTSLSYVQVGYGAASSGVEVYRYPLPNFIIYSVTTKLSQETGERIRVRIRYDFSDRPQWLGLTCNGAAAPGSPCGDVIAVYSTTPTAGQSEPFEKNNGSVRWENLITHQSHFWWEHADGQGDRRADTLEIERYAAQGIGADSLLVPFLQPAIGPMGDTAYYAVVFRIPALGFRDTTFVRNSGNFRRAIIGEGGRVIGQFEPSINSRAMMYDATIGMKDTAGPGYRLQVPVRDGGISRALDVSDYVANTSARVFGVGINFDGEIGAIRADSAYLIDPTLRLQGILSVTGTNAGFDFHPQNAGMGTATPPDQRIAFSASMRPEIDVFDTYFYNRVGCIPVRDPIIGPIKASVRGTRIVLVAATANGVIIVSLPNVRNSTCS